VALPAMRCYYIFIDSCKAWDTLGIAGQVSAGKADGGKQRYGQQKEML
jgi:hypothetical protein